MGTTALLFAAALWAGVQNALAGGGLVHHPAGPDPFRARCPGRPTSPRPSPCSPASPRPAGWAERWPSGAGFGLSFRTLAIISLIGGAVGAGLLLATPSHFFARMVPWLVLFATGLFACGSFFRGQGEGSGGLGPRVAGSLQFLIAIYGGYFGGGIGFLMLAALTAAGQAVRSAGATKNVLAAAMNASAVAVFLFTPGIPWPRVGVVCGGAILGGLVGAQLLKRVDERLIRGFVVVLGLALTVGLFLRGSSLG